MRSFFYPPSTSHPIIEPIRAPEGIAHQRSFPLLPNPASPPPNNAPATVPPEQSLSSTSCSSYILVLVVFSGVLSILLLLQGYSTVSFQVFIYPGLFAVTGTYSSLYSSLKQVFD